jgi:hypothetical protein
MPSRATYAWFRSPARLLSRFKIPKRLAATPGAPGDFSKSSPEIVASEYRLFEPAAYEKHGPLPSAIDSRLPKPSVPPERLSFLIAASCRLTKSLSHSEQMG